MVMGQEGKTYIFSGNTLLPKDAPNRDQLQRTIALMEVDPEKEIIVKASFFTFLSHTNDFLSSLAEGYDLKQGIEPLLEEMEIRAHIPTIRALVQAVEIAYQKYLNFRKSNIL